MASLTVRATRSGNVSGWAAGTMDAPETVFIMPPRMMDRSGHREVMTRATVRGMHKRDAPTLEQWRALQRAKPGWQPSPTPVGRQPFQRPVIQRPAPPHRAPPQMKASPRAHRPPPTLDVSTRWAHPRQALDMDDTGLPLNTRMLRKMLRDAGVGIEVSERDIALMLHDANARKDLRGPALNMPKLLAQLKHLQMSAQMPSPPPTPQHLPMPDLRMPDHNLPFDVPPRVRYAFAAVDMDKSGFLEGNEILMAVRRYGMDPSDKSIVSRVVEAAGDDGRLDFSEFAVLVAQLEKDLRLTKQLRSLSAAVTPRPQFSPRFM